MFFSELFKITSIIYRNTSEVVCVFLCLLHNNSLFSTDLVSTLTFLYCKVVLLLLLRE